MNPSERTFNLNTIRYPINKTTGWAGDDCDGTGVCSDNGANIPLNSTHHGGVNVLFGDGSVRFLSENISIDLLARLAIRDDGKVLDASY